MRRSSLAFATACSLACALGAGSARADVTSWLALGGGYTTQRDQATSSSDQAKLFSYSMGVGTSPASSLVLGGLFRGTTMFGLGTDLGLAARATTGGFARGDWGVALDAGAIWRPWRGGDYGAWPWQGVLTVGSPWGFQLAMGGQTSSITGDTSAQGVFAEIELDFLRLTVMRQGSSEHWWRNPIPAGGHTTALLWW